MKSSLCIGLLAALVGSAEPAHALTVETVRIDRMHILGTPADVGVVTVVVGLDPTLPPSDAVVNLDESAPYEFVNVTADLGEGEEWIVRNVPLPRQPGTADEDGGVSLSTVFELDPATDDYSDLNVTVSNEMGEFGHPESSLASFGPDGGTVGVDDRNATGKNGATDLVSFPPFDAPLQVSHFVTPVVPSIVDKKLRTNVPDYTQDQNNADIDTDNPPDGSAENNRGHDECGPTATANSVRWLANTYGFGAKIDSPTPSGNTADDDLITSLVSAMDTNRYRTGAGSSGIGTDDEDFVAGKKSFFSDAKVSMDVEFMDGNTTIDGQAQAVPTASFLWDALSDGKDIEIGFSFVAGGGHWVTLVGGIHWSDGSYGVYVNDPDNGRVSTDYYVLGNRTAGGKTYFELRGYGWQNFIDIAVSEEYTGPPPSKSQRKCIKTSSKALGKMKKTAGKQVASCLRDAARGQAIATLEECFSLDPGAKIDKVATKLNQKVQLLCDPMPDVAFANPNTVATAAPSVDVEIVRTVLGPGLDEAVLPSAVNPKGASCQRKLTRALSKCGDAQLKTFARCVDETVGARDLAYIDARDVAPCFAPFGDDKLVKACVDKVGQAAADCEEDDVDLSEAFPGCGAATADEIAPCLDTTIACTTCNAASAGYALALPCDYLDDGDRNGSCVAP